MNAFRALLDLSAGEKQKQGVEFTPPEIAQQPDLWQETADLLVRQRDQLLAFLTEAGVVGDREATVLLTGAGTSEFVGNAASLAMRRTLKRDVISVPTTHLVTHARQFLLEGRPSCLISFARSGNSPESVATFNAARRVAGIRQLVVTCNPDGALAAAARADGTALCLVLPEKTNDRSLAMTSSFSCMALTACALPLLATPDHVVELAATLALGGRRVLEHYGDALKAFAERPFTRACFLGANTLYGTMQECHLKLQEMTEGRVACRFDSFLGLRHGPQVFVNDACVVVASLSSAPYPRRYEMDMLRELRTKQQGCGVLVTCDRANDDTRSLADVVVELYPDGNAVDDDYRIMTDVVVGQVLATFKSMAVGLKPDAPSENGTINRVVQGVTIYDED